MTAGGAHQPRPLRVGSVVELARQGSFALALLTAREGDKGWRVIDQRARRDTVGERAVVLAVGITLDPDLPQEAVQRTLDALDQEATRRAPSVDALAELWELLIDAPDLVELDTVTDLLFSGRVEPSTRLATVRALREDRVRFKCRDGEHIELRGREAVARREAELAAVARFEGGRAAFVRTASALLEAPPASRGAALADALDDAVFRAYLELVETYATHGDRAPVASDAEPIVAEIQGRVARQLPGGRARRALEFLVAIGHWDADRNLLFERWDVPNAFAPPELAEAAAIRDHLAERIADPDDLGDRVDFTGWLTVTVDHEETHDLDDAVSVRRLDDGNTEVAVHITAPAAAIELDSTLDLAARERGTSLYLPTGVVPMLPDALGVDGLSLIVGAVRPAISFLAAVDPGGEIVSERIVRSLVRVDQRMTNGEVDLELEIGSGPLADALLDLYTAADALHTNRAMRGAYDLAIPERKVRLKDDGWGHRHIDVELLPMNSMSRLMVGELAVLANTIAARFCAARDVPVPYRTQIAPDPPIEDDDFDHIPDGLARAFAMRRRMRPARSSTSPGRHFALAVASYCQVTSPLRRYNDFLAHVQLEAVLADGEARLDTDALTARLRPADQAAGMGRKLQRESESYWLLRRFADQQGLPTDATVIEVDAAHPTRATVVLHDTVHRATLQTRREQAVGAVIQVAVEEADPRRKLLILSEVE